MAFRIVSLNVWGGRIYEQLGRFVIDVRADILCLQEMFHAPESPLRELPDGDGFVLRPNLFGDLRRMLPYHEAFFWPFARGYLNDRTTTDAPVFYGIATFVRRTIPIVRSHTGFTVGAFRAQPKGNPPLPRTAHAFRLWDYEENAPVVIVHTHGLWDPRGKMDTPQRAEQAIRLRGLVDAVADDLDKIVICGDLNILPENWFFAAYREWYGLRDLVTARGHHDTRTSYYKKATRYADYMLVGPDVRVAGFAVPAEPEVSDHRPLILDCS